jgi:hypothetical protein
MDFGFSLIALIILIIMWWLYSTRKVILERHDWLQKELDERTAERDALLDIMAQRAFTLKFIDENDDVTQAAIAERRAARLASDPVFRRMSVVAMAAEDVDAESKWRKMWLE